MTMSATYTDLGDGIIHIDAEYLSPSVASVYLLIEGRECAIIETGTCHTVPYIMSVLNDYGLNANSVRYVIPTHVHLDHAGGVGSLMEICPNASLVVHPLGSRHMIDPSKLTEGASAVYGEETFKKLYGVLKPVGVERVIEAPDNISIKLGKRTLHFYDTPGHARHHFCVHDLQSNTIFSGDTFGIAYPSLETLSGPFIFATTTPVQFDPEALHTSIDRLASINPSAFNLTHFGRIEPTEAIIKQLKATLNKYLEIAESHKQIGDNRKELIDQAISDYLLSEYYCFGGIKDEQTVRQTIAMDSTLNAQGLDFWLSKKN